MRQNKPVLQASILDRLIDYEPSAYSESVQYSLTGIEQIKFSVVRDLENLLNTRRQILTPSAKYKEANNSFLMYGLKDFTSENPKSLFTKQKLRQDIEKTIARFEYRLQNVGVHFEISSNKNEKSLRFRIVGLLVVEPITEPVTFDTYFDVNRGEYVISK